MPRADTTFPKLGAAMAALAAMLLSACSGETREIHLRPPDGWRDAVRAESRAAAAQARRTSEALLRRSPGAVAPPLAAGIRFSRAQALRDDVRRMPPEIHKALEPYFGPEILDSTRWSLAGDDLGVGTLLARWYYEEGAVTLRDVIVFSDAKVARNVWLWAHELAHVEQYRRYGIDGFARRYAADWRALEAEATARAFAITADIRAKQAARPRPMAAAVDQVEGMLDPLIDGGRDDPPAAESAAPPEVGPQASL